MYCDTFTEYSLQARVTDKHDYTAMGIPPLAYHGLALGGEAGELANKLKKLYRDDGGVMTEARKQDIISEMGDCLWYLDALARNLGTSLNAVATANIAKLLSRRERGVVGGDGDHR